MNDDEKKKNNNNIIINTLPNHSNKETRSSSTSNNSSATTTTTTTTWLRQKDPRIVRVCKALGGKDRHSKVCTIRGLRDRRVRLSVPTAIQLYDLQDRLGLTQPSKAVDWLLNAAKSEIDELPPLPISPSQFCLNPNNNTNNTMINWAEISQQQQQQLWWSSNAGAGTSSTATPPTNNIVPTAEIFSRRGDGMEEKEENDEGDRDIINEVHDQQGYYDSLQAQAQNPNKVTTMFNLGSGHPGFGGLSQTKDDHPHHHHYHQHQQLLHHLHHNQHQKENMEMSAPLSLSNNTYYPQHHLAAAAAAGENEVGPAVRYGDHGSSNQMLMSSSSGGAAAAAAAAYFNIDHHSRSSPAVMPFHQLTELSMMSSRFPHSHHRQPSSSDDDRRGGGQEFHPSP
ncbi:unnamed protein product [Linum trigynum]|uniref:TCP domain-containing protein n=1 Tax=Linum trigynum TaxID=586398 RepID=A0AAV2F265_9ROSI